jgi:hypothetical protein
MICPEHDTHIDNCVNERHCISDNWEIRIPIRCSSEDVLKYAMQFKSILESSGRDLVPVNIGVQPRPNDHERCAELGICICS